MHLPRLSPFAAGLLAVGLLAVGLLLGGLSTASAQEPPRAPGGEWSVARRPPRELRWERIDASAEEGPSCEAGGRARVIRLSPALAYARCAGEDIQRREGSGPWRAWASLPDSGAALTAALSLDADRALFALADGRIYVLYGNRFRRDAEGQRVLAFALLGDQVYARTPGGILRRPIPPPTASYCQVQVEAVLSAQAFRGSPPPTPATQGAQSDPRWEAEEHGESHVQCRYRVRLRGRSYSYLHAVSTTAEEVGPPGPYCDSQRPQIAEQIRSFTEQCVDLRAGEYYGHRLVPLR